MSGEPLFESASGYQDNVLALPVGDIDTTARWYCKAFGMTEIERHGDPNPAVVLDRDGTRIGFSVNGGDASQDGAAIQVADIRRARAELESNGVKTANWRVEERDGQKLQVFFVVAPDGLCYYFYQPIAD